MDPLRMIKQSTGAGVVFVAVLCVICYANTLGHEFVFDDLDVIVRNPLVTDPASGLGDIFTAHYWQHITATGNLYRPVTIASYRLNHLAGGLDPFGYHLVNILLHALCSGLLVVLARRLGLSAGAAIAAGAFFATHPIHTEAVANVIGRAELLAAAGVLSAWVVHLSDRRGGTGRLTLLGSLFAFGLLSKENAIVLPALMLAGDMVRWRRAGAGARWPRAGYVVCAAVAIAWLLLRAMLLPPVAAGSPSQSVFAGVPAGVRVLTALSVLARYLWLLVYPVHLSADYSYEAIPVATSLADPLALAGLLGMALLFLWTAVRLLGRRPRIDAVGTWVLLAGLAPVSNLIVPIGTIMGERLLYLPSAGFCLAAACLPGARRRAGPLLAVLAALLVAAYSARTIDRNKDWADQLTLFSATAVTSPRSAKVHYNLALALEKAGRNADAIEQYGEALEIKPDDARSRHNRGLLLARAGRMAEALEDLEQAARLVPSSEGIQRDLGLVYFSLDRPGDAERAFRRQLGLTPEDHAALYNLGTLLISEGRPAEAVDPLREAIEVSPRDADTRYQLGLAYRLSGRPDEAIEQFEASIGLQGSLHEADLQLALCHLALGETDRAAEAAARARDNGIALPTSLRRLLDGPAN